MINNDYREIIIESSVSMTNLFSFRVDKAFKHVLDEGITNVLSPAILEKMIFCRVLNFLDE